MYRDWLLLTTSIITTVVWTAIIFPPGLLEQPPNWSFHDLPSHLQLFSQNDFLKQSYNFPVQNLLYGFHPISNKIQNPFLWLWHLVPGYFSVSTPHPLCCIHSGHLIVPKTSGTSSPLHVPFSLLGIPFPSYLPDLTSSLLPVSVGMWPYQRGLPWFLCKIGSCPVHFFYLTLLYVSPEFIPSDVLYVLPLRLFIVCPLPEMAAYENLDFAHCIYFCITST